MVLDAAAWSEDDKPGALWEPGLGWAAVGEECNSSKQQFSDSESPAAQPRRRPTRGAKFGEGLRILFNSDGPFPEEPRHWHNRHADMTLCSHVADEIFQPASALLGEVVADHVSHVLHYLEMEVPPVQWPQL